MTTKEMITVMQAFEGGERIESTSDGMEWVDCPYPNWNWGFYDYRIKPKPFKKEIKGYFGDLHFCFDMKESIEDFYLPCKGKYKITIEEIAE